MASTHVLMETNWVVDVSAPTHFRAQGALELLRKAAEGSIVLHLPAVCLIEARNVVRKKFQPRHQLVPIRKYIRWAKENGRIDSMAADNVRQTLEQYEQSVAAELDNLEVTLGGLLKAPGVDVFPLSELMLEQALSLAIEKLDLRPFDSAILAAILVFARALKDKNNNSEILFCTLDSDLQPWDKNGNMKPVLLRLYDEAHVWVYGDYEMTSHERPVDWPK